MKTNLQRNQAVLFLSPVWLFEAKSTLENLICSCSTVLGPRECAPAAKTVPNQSRQDEQYGFLAMLEAGTRARNQVQMS
jgi:hypothetical protein